MRDWQGRVDQLSDVQKLVHLAFRFDDLDAERIRGELVKVGRRAYEDELTIQAARAGCPGRTGRLTTGPSLTELNDRFKADAESIVATYNWDLASAIESIAASSPRANRNHYATNLAEWDLARAEWKGAQVAEYTEGVGRSLAQSDFVSLNNLDGVARLEPREASCDVCRGWVKRGNVPMQEATNNSGPFHPNCPHIWTLSYRPKVARNECPNLWVGE